jgi:hypothetical protein
VSEHPNQENPDVELANDEGADPSDDIAHQNEGAERSDEQKPASDGDDDKDESGIDAAEAHPS